MPVADGETSKIWIWVKSDGQLEQIVKQLQKLEEVHTIGYHDAGHEIFIRLEDSFKVIQRLSMVALMRSRSLFPGNFLQTVLRVTSRLLSICLGILSSP